MHLEQVQDLRDQLKAERERKQETHLDDLNDYDLSSSGLALSHPATWTFILSLLKWWHSQNG